MLKILFCLTILFIIFIVLKFCLRNKEKFVLPPATDNTYKVIFNEKLDIENFYNYFLELHDYGLDRTYQPQKLELK